MKLKEYFTRRWLFEEVNNSPLVVFRVAFGVLMAWHSFSTIWSGHVWSIYIYPEFTFSFIGFEWLQPLLSDWMVHYFVLMGITGVFIALGLFYRASASIFFVLWTASYLMQKSAYNNHYYLMILLAAVMIIMPAHKRFSLDLRFGWTKYRATCPRICLKFWVVQVGLVYTVASLNKVHADWLRAAPISIWFSSRDDLFLLGPLMVQTWFHYLISYGGIFYDGLITPILLHKKTRNIGFFLSIIFNAFNKYVFGIGIFPLLMISLTVFFYSPDTVSRWFFRKKSVSFPNVSQLSSLKQTWIYYTFIVYFVIQIALPVRHYLFEGDVHWTEEGHRLSWQMMLRSKRGEVKFMVVDNTKDKWYLIDPKKRLPKRQAKNVATHPDFIWQYAQKLKEDFKVKGIEDLSIYVTGEVTLNDRKPGPMVDPSVDFAKAKWSRFRHNDWLMPVPGKASAKETAMN